MEIKKRCKSAEQRKQMLNINLNNTRKCSHPSDIKTSSNKEIVMVVPHTQFQILFNKLSMMIELIPNKEARKNNPLGSLYGLFNSEYFDIHLLMTYLDKKEEQGIIDTLVNILSKRFINESFFYIPQLCTMITYKPYYESLENYILDRCVDQMKFSLKVHWLISSYTNTSGKTDVSPEDIKIVKKYDKLVQRIEMTLVNGRRATMSSFRLYNSLYVKSEEEVYKHSLDKESRLNYFERAMKFYQELQMMCEKLKDFPKENKLDPSNTRNGVMRSHLVNFNRNIKKMSNMAPDARTTTKSFYRGFILPFDDSISTMDDFNSLIVNFLPEYCFCFSTKARVPVKVVVEVVRVKECEFWDELYEPHVVVNADCGNPSPYLQTEENSKLEQAKIEGEYNAIKVNEFSSIEDFFKRIANATASDVRNPKRNSTSTTSTVQKEPLEENFLFDHSEHTINPFGAKWSDTVKLITEKSHFKHFETYSVKCFMAKANDDLRQEVMTMQLIKRFDDVFRQAEIPLKLRPYEILITSQSSGLIEFLPNTISIDALKKNLPLNMNLNSFFRNFFTSNFEEAQKNFAESLAAYSIISYMIAIRDRHNGNILLDMNGHIIHIDFGFILGISPGNLSFENAPFKLTAEYVDILDGPESNIFHYFKSLILRGLMELKKHVDSFVKIVEIMARGSKMPCFFNVDTNFIVAKFVERFHMNKTEYEYVLLVEELINNSLNNWRTAQYDNFQKYTNDIKP